VVGVVAHLPSSLHLDIDQCLCPPRNWPRLELFLIIAADVLLLSPYSIYSRDDSTPRTLFTSKVCEAASRRTVNT